MLKFSTLKKPLTAILVGCLCLCCVQCSKASKEYCTKKGANIKMSFSEARQIAEQSDCLKVGQLKSEHWCNENSGTWWIMLKANLKGCSPACVIDVVNKSASVNYMCTGLLRTAKKM